MHYTVKKYFFIGICVLAIGYALFCFNPFTFYFQNDDFAHILLSKKGIFFQHRFFRPLSDASLMLDWFLWKTNAAGYHFTNLLLHAACSVLLYGLVHRLSRAYLPFLSASYIAVIASVLFFVYPFHSETVFWILGRGGSLGVLFSLLFFLFYVSPNYKKQWIGFLFLIAGFLSYENTWAIPLICWMAFLWNKNHRNWQQPAFVSIIFLIYFFIRKNITHEWLGTYEAHALINGDWNMIVNNFLKLLFRSFFPYTHVSIIWFVLLAVLYVIVFIIFLKASRHIQRTIVFLMLCFLISLLPYLSLGISVRSSESERFLYFPSLLLCIALAVLIVSCKSFWFQSIYFTSIVAVWLYLLSTSAMHYKTAGEIVSLLFNEIKKLPQKNTLYIVELPQSQAGALILRNNIEAAWQFIQPDIKIKQVFVCSKKNEKLLLPTHYKVVYKPIENVMACGMPVSRNDAVFEFTDSLLIIRK